MKIDLLDSLERCILTRRLFAPAEPLLLAVSGGVDSMVLLGLLHQLAPRHGWQLTAAHLNHQLRGRSSDADERLVRETAAALRLPLVVERANVRQHARVHGLSLEMAARELRHGFLVKAAARAGATTIALAHHADDQLENFFLRLLRGAGPEGLAGMKWQGRSPADPGFRLVRPLLEVPKAALHEYATQKKLKFREDATNARLDIQRNRVRHELLPLLRRNYQPALSRTVLRVMDIMGAEAEFISQSATDWLAAKKRRPFDSLPLALQRRCLQLQLFRHRISADFELVEQLRTTVDKPISIPSPAPASPAGVPGPRSPSSSPRRVVRDAHGLIHFQSAPAKRFATNLRKVRLTKPSGELLFGSVKIRWQFRTVQKPSLPAQAIAGLETFDADRIGDSIVLRHWQPGDRFQPSGLPSPVKLQDLFVNRKIPRNQRLQMTVAVTATNEIFWVESLRIAERFKLSGSTNRHLQWRWQRV